MSGRLVLFNTALSELKLTFQIRDEDTTEVLKLRYRIVTGNTPARPPSSYMELDYDCPEPPIPGTPGQVERGDVDITIGGTHFARGQCYRIDVAVSSSFKSCIRNPELFDITTNEDNEEDVGRASYWVWAVNGNAVPTENMAAQLLLDSCPHDLYQPPTGTTASAVEK